MDREALYRDPYPVYARARAAPGLTFVEELDAWLVARHADVREVLSRPGDFSSRGALRPDVLPGPRAFAELAGAPGGAPVVLSADGEAHARASGTAETLTGELARALDDRDEIVSNAENLMLAGHLTTTALLGSTVHHLLRDRRQWELLCARPELVPAAIEEAARYEAPVQGFRRTVTRPLTLSGTKLAEGPTPRRPGRHHGGHAHPPRARAASPHLVAAPRRAAPAARPGPPPWTARPCRSR